MNLDDLENKVSELWGPSQFDWTIGRCPEGWFYYCGTGWHPYKKTHWACHGYADTISGALQAMIGAHPGDGFAYDVPAEIKKLHLQEEIEKDLARRTAQS